MPYVCPRCGRRYVYQGYGDIFYPTRWVMLTVIAGNWENVSREYVGYPHREEEVPLTYATKKDAEEECGSHVKDYNNSVRGYFNSNMQYDESNDIEDYRISVSDFFICTLDHYLGKLGGPHGSDN
jgi:hypothetical protein